jgi:Zn-dependent protease with chaperone function
LGVMFISWGAADMPHFYASRDGLNFFVWMLFVFELICFAYASSFMFKSPKSCIWTMPVFVIITLISPNIILLIGIQIAKAAGASVNETDQSKRYIFLSLFLSFLCCYFSLALSVSGFFLFFSVSFFFLCSFSFRSWYSSLGHSHSFTVWCNFCLHFKHYQ